MSEGLATLPDPSIIETFNPLDYLLDGNKGIAEIPDNPDFLLRWWPRLRGDQTNADIDTLDFEWSFTTATAFDKWPCRADEEFDKLRFLGIASPEPGRDITRFLGDARIVALDGIAKVVQYSLVRRYQGESLEETDPIGIPYIRKFTDYLEQSLSSEHILYDALRARQNLKLHRPINGKRLMHVDTEPMVVTIDTGIQNITTFQYGCNNLINWGKRAGASGHMIDRIDELSKRGPSLY